MGTRQAFAELTPLPLQPSPRRDYPGPAREVPFSLPQSRPLLLVDDEAWARTQVLRCLNNQGFAVTAVSSADEAMEAAAEIPFTHAVVELRLGRDTGPGLVTELRGLQPAMQIVVVTGFDSFASAIVTLRAGACGYLPKPVDAKELVDALLGQTPQLPTVPDMPLALVRVSWEHTRRVFEQCDRNVTRTAHCLSMHRRTLQRILVKRSPPLRRMPGG